MRISVLLFLCSHVFLAPGGLISTAIATPADFEWSYTGETNAKNDTIDAEIGSQLESPVPDQDRFVLVPKLRQTDSDYLPFFNEFRWSTQDSKIRFEVVFQPGVEHYFVIPVSFFSSGRARFAHFKFRIKKSSEFGFVTVATSRSSDWDIPAAFGLFIPDLNCISQFVSYGWPGSTEIPLVSGPALCTSLPTLKTHIIMPSPSPSNVVEFSMNNVGRGAKATDFTWDGFFIGTGDSVNCEQTLVKDDATVTGPTCERLPIPGSSPSLSVSATVSPTSTASVSYSATSTPSISMTVTPSISGSASASPSTTESASPSISTSASISPSPTVSVSPSPTSSQSLVISASPSITPSASGTSSPTVSASASVSESAIPSYSSSPSLTASASVSESAMPSQSSTPSVSVSASASESIIPSYSSSPSLTSSVSVSESGMPSYSSTPSLSVSSSVSESALPSQSSSPSVTATPSLTASSTATVTVSMSSSMSVSSSNGQSESSTIAENNCISMMPNTRALEDTVYADESFEDTWEYIQDGFESSVNFQLMGRINVKQIANGVIQVRIIGRRKTRLRGASVFASFEDVDSFGNQFENIDSKSSVRAMVRKVHLKDVKPIPSWWYSCCGKQVYIYVKYLACRNVRARVAIVGQRREQRINGCDLPPFTGLKKYVGFVGCQFVEQQA